ncbi:MAG: HesA/MoeB/ThiF family protein [Crocinitomicaceae bacterium]
MLIPEDRSRYSRHLLLNEVGEEGQRKLKSAKVLVIGAGGLGCPVLQYLTAAGVGQIGIIDFDVVDESNLQRQVLFDTIDVGKSKALTAREKLEAKNPLIHIEAFDTKLTQENALDLFEKYDLIVDGTDNFATRYLVNDACVITGKPLVYGSIHKFEGQVSVFNYQGGPTYRDVFPTPPDPGVVPSCSEVGVIGVLPGIIGTQQANEALKIILGIGEPLNGTLMIYSALKSDYTKLKISHSELRIPNLTKEEFLSFDYEYFCGIPGHHDGLTKQKFEEILAKEFVVDVRESWEKPALNQDNVLNAPLDDLEDYIDQIPRDRKVYVVCQKGGRSKAAIEILEYEHNFDNLINVEGGLLGLV